MRVVNVRRVGTYGVVLGRDDGQEHPGCHLESCRRGEYWVVRTSIDAPQSIKDCGTRAQ